MLPAEGVEGPHLDEDVPCGTLKHGHNHLLPRARLAAKARQLASRAVGDAVVIEERPLGRKHAPVANHLVRRRGVQVGR